jgi:hypothetical protein
MGLVNYDIPPVEPPPSTPPDEPDEPEEPSGAQEQPPDTPKSPPENPQTPEEPPDNVTSAAFFTISDLAAPPAVISHGDSVTFSAKISNTGGQPGDYEATLTLNGTVMITKHLTIEPNNSQAISFSLQDLEPGQYSFSLNGLSGSFTVADPEAVETPPEAPQQEPPDFDETSEGGFPASTVVYIFDAMLVGIIVWLVLKRRRVA